MTTRGKTNFQPQSFELSCGILYPPMNLDERVDVRLSELDYRQRLSRTSTVVAKFVQAIRREIRLDFESIDMVFYKVVDDKWAQHGTPPGQPTPSPTAVGHKLYINDTLEKKLGPFQNLSEDIVSIVIGFVEGAPLQRFGRVSQDILASLPVENERYLTALKTKNKSTSTGSESSEYAETQAGPDNALFDGLVNPNVTTVTIPPPLHLFHEVFQQFTRDANRSTTSIPRSFLQSVLKLMNHAAKIKSPPENTWNSQTRSLLSAILGSHVHTGPDVETSSPDAVTMVELNDSIWQPTCLGEFKRFYGESGYDMTVQAGNSMRRMLRDPSRKAVIDRSCSPIFMIIIGGPWLAILGGVLTDRYIVQRLTDMLWLAPSTTHDDQRVYHVAGVLYALSKAIASLKAFYTNIMETTPDFDPRRVHPRHFPYPNSYVKDGTLFQFRYLGGLENDSRCVTYLAEVVRQFEPDGERIELVEEEKERLVIKFVERYGEEVHRFLAARGKAPLLRYYGPLPATRIPYEPTYSCVAPLYSEPYATSRSPALSTDMKMVVMDYVETGASSKLDQDTFQILETVISDLHTEGYVLGDLREPNILLDSDGNIQLIDFDWAGRYDAEINDTEALETVEDGVPKDSPFTHYPLSLSSNLFEGIAKPLDPIRPSHDRTMFQNFRRQF